MAKIYQIFVKTNNLNLNQLRGFEGIAARLYFTALGGMIRASALPEFAFTARSKRPPKDRFNATLSFLYSLLAADVSCILVAKRFDLAVGFLHTGKDAGAAALAFDVMEPFRITVADRLARRIVNRGELDAVEDFECTDIGCWLSKIGKLKIISRYQAFMNTAPRPGVSRSPLAIIEDSSRELRELIQSMSCA